MKRILAGCLAALMLACAFAGCGAGASGAAAASVSAAAAGSGASASGSASAAGGKVLRVAFECQSAPFCWTQSDDSNGALKLTGTDEYTYGFDVEMMKQLCAKAGYTIEAYKIDWDGMLMGVQAGTYDCAISGISITDERKVSMDFTDPYYKANIVLLTRADGKYASAARLSDFAGCSTTSMLNTIWYDMCSQIPNASIQPALENLPALIVAVQSGAVDAVPVDIPTAKAAVLANPDLVMVEPDASDTFAVTDADVDLGIAVTKGKEQIVSDLNAALATIPQDERDAMLDKAISVQPLAQQ